MIELAPNNAYGLALANPLIAAAGCFGYGVEYARLVELSHFGAIVTRTTTLRPRRTASPPRLLETPAGVLAVGPWPNPGIERVIERHAETWAGWPTKVILSLGGESSQDFATMAAGIEGIEGIAALELALPEDPARALPIIAAVRRSTFLPVLAKLPRLDPEPLLALAQAAAEAGADALTLCAPPLGSALDAQGELVTGWLCGPATQPLALRLLGQIAGQLALPVVACGGVGSPADAERFIQRGASAVQIGAALLANPFLLSVERNSNDHSS